MPRVLHWDYEHQVSGDFPDWKERMPKEERAGSVARGLLRGSATTGLSGKNPTVDPAHVPRHLQLVTKGRHRNRSGIVDAFSTVNGLTIVSRRTAELIEAMDPGRHQLFEIEALTNYANEPLEEAEAHGPYFILNVRAVQDALDREALGYGPAYPRFPDYYGLGRQANVVLRADRLDPEIDMWRERCVLETHIFVSDRLATAMDERGIAFFTPVPATIGIGQRDGPDNPKASVGPD